MRITINSKFFLDKKFIKQFYFFLLSHFILIFQCRLIPNLVPQFIKLHPIKHASSVFYTDIGIKKELKIKHILKIQKYSIFQIGKQSTFFN